VFHSSGLRVACPAAHRRPSRWAERAKRGWGNEELQGIAGEPQLGRPTRITRAGRTAPLSDAVLMAAVQDGDLVALGALYRRLAARAYRAAVAICRDSACAEDAVQDAFVAIWSSRSTYAPDRGSVLAWAMAIVRHRAIYLSRRRALGLDFETPGERLAERAATDDVPSEFAARDEAQRLDRLVERLPPRQREVIQLGFFDGLTHEQIAYRLELPPGTVKGRMRLGLTKLRCELEREREGGLRPPPAREARRPARSA
jgi:RNA polymerase sigma-70 factor, ECF subfamily